MTYLPLLEHRHDAEGIIPLNQLSPGLAAAAEMYEARTANIVPISPVSAQNIAAPDKRISVLTEAQSLVHGSRNEAYGSPLSDYSRTAGMVSAMLAHKLKEPLTAEDCIQIMICVKLSRQQNKPKRDNAVDGAGYFECLQWALDDRAARE